MSHPSDFDTVAQLPCWRGRVEVAPLIGGMTNRNLRVTDADGQRYVVRVGADLPQHGSLRFNEQAAARAAFAAGISPEVIHTQAGLLVCRFINGRTLAPEDIRQPAQLRRVVELLRRCHHDVPRHFRGPALMFWVFQVVRGYLGLLAEGENNRLQLPLDELQRCNRTLERALGPVSIVFGHNDLLAANFIDDGERLWLIDFDYAGFNTPLFDLANLASNNDFDAGLDALLQEHYFGNAGDARLREALDAMKCASLLREMLWAAVSLLRPPIEFDYASYARDYQARFERAWQQFKHHPQ